MIDQRVWRLTPNFFSYTLSKAALWTATQTMAQALAPHASGSTPSVLGPTHEKCQRQSEEDFAQTGRRPIPLRHGAEARAKSARQSAILWENRSITGQMTALDGGQHLAWETPDVAGIAE